MSNEIKKRVSHLHNIYKEGIDNIVEWTELIPALQQTEASLGFIENSLSESPSLLDLYTDEELIDYLDKATQGASNLSSFSHPTEILTSDVLSSGSAIPSLYVGYVRRVSKTSDDHPELSIWAEHTIEEIDIFREKQHRSEIVNTRLTLLKPELGLLHKDAVSSSLEAQAGIQSSIGPAMTLNRLLDQFKGYLLDKCKGGKGNNYSRISTYLASDSPFTKSVISDGQQTYNDLSNELMRIRKRMIPCDRKRIIELLRQVEDHIIVITDALDPIKLGISFK
jgi:hypothetical protein